MSENHSMNNGARLSVMPRALETDGRRPWDRLEGESSVAFAAFSAYRDLGADRSLVKVGQQLGKSRALMERWSVAWNWVGRAWEFDVAEDERAREQLARDRISMRRRQIRLGVAMQEIGCCGLRELQQRIERCEPLGLTVDEIVSLMRVGADLERRATGEESESQYTKIVVNLGGYEDEQEYEDALRAKDDTVN